MFFSPVRPDGHGIWAQDGQRVAFFLEFDTGTESQTVLLGKLTRYAKHVREEGPKWPVLFRLHSIACEQHFHALLAQDGAPVPVATTTAEIQGAGGSPADRIWLLHRSDRRPRRLIDLAGVGHPAPPAEDT